MVKYEGTELDSRLTSEAPRLRAIRSSRPASWCSSENELGHHIDASDLPNAAGTLRDRVLELCREVKIATIMV